LTFIVYSLRSPFRFPHEQKTGFNLDVFLSEHCTTSEGSTHTSDFNEKIVDDDLRCITKTQ